LFQASMLFVGLIVLLVLRSFMTAARFDVKAILVIFLMGLICFVPFGLFARGATMRQRT
jgi:hypothetical protein